MFGGLEGEEGEWISGLSFGSTYPMVTWGVFG